MFDVESNDVAGDLERYRGVLEAVDRNSSDARWVPWAYAPLSSNLFGRTESTPAAHINSLANYYSSRSTRAKNMP